jgi:Mlc titration factor MtfA (ptsG expression regulator)
MFGIGAWWRRRRLSKVPFSTVWFDALVERVPELKRLGTSERMRLAERAREFLAGKALHGADGLDIDESISTKIATLAAWPALNLGPEAFEGWSDVVIYPGTFRARRRKHDRDTGIVREYDEDLAGEAWSSGPMVISLEDLMLDLAHPEDEQNVVIHEMAHKIDGLDGDMDGRPPLHRGMDPEEWRRTMQRAFDLMNHRLDHGLDTPIDPYAATAPEEFFAVCSEYYHLAPSRLAEAYPEVHRLLQQFYRPAALA